MYVSFIYICVVEVTSHIQNLTQWLLCLNESLKQYEGSIEEIYETLRTYKMVYLNGGRLVSIEDGSVFFPFIQKKTKKSKPGIIKFIYTE